MHPLIADWLYGDLSGPGYKGGGCRAFVTNQLKVNWSYSVLSTLCIFTIVIGYVSSQLDRLLFQFSSRCSRIYIYILFCVYFPILQL